jgi:RHS repeat-associated protein
VYNDFNQLRYVISPKAVEYLDNNGWNLTQTIIEELCFVYGYDKRARQTVKQQPGVKPSYFVYDKKNRLVLSQDGKQTDVQQWSFTLYDDLDRTIGTGLLKSTASSIDNLQAEVYAINTSGNTSLTINVGVSENIMVEDPVVVCPSCSNIEYHSVAEYDKYNYPSVKSFNSNYSFAPSASTTVDPIQKSNRITGFVTGEKVRIIGTSQFLTSTVYYDEKGRMVQSLADNIKNGLDYQTSQYDFSGKVLSNFISHSIQANSSPFVIISKLEYDKVGRLLKLSKNFHQSFYKELVEYTYDALGRIQSKRLAPGYIGSGNQQMESLEYSYNIQGWLKGINEQWALSNDIYTHWDHFFGMHLGYENGDANFTDAQYNGSITGAIWRSQGNNSPNRYDYTYDNLGRFTSAVFQQKKTPADNWSQDVDYSSYVQYEDGNGNIKSLQHMGMIAGTATPQMIDVLKYQYNQIGSTTLYGNRLVRVTDNSSLNPADNGLLGDFKDSQNPNSDDYTYDKNGNLEFDDNKGLKVQYNSLNKPSTILVNNKQIDFTYDASGEKLSKKVTANGSSVTTYYIGDFIYQENDLQFILHEEGRVKIIDFVHDLDRDLNGGNYAVDLGSGKQGVFEYFIKDNLGNTRMVLTEEEQAERYFASNEENRMNIEPQLFGRIEDNGNIDASKNELILTRVKTIQTPWTTNNSDFVNELTANFTNSTNKMIGPTMLLKVMAGDVISSNVQYYFVQNNVSVMGNPAQDVATSLVNALVGFKGGTIAQHNGNNVGSLLQGSSDFQQFMQDHYDNNPTNPNAPRGYLNMVFLDEQFNFIPYDFNASNEGTGSQRVQTPNNPDFLYLDRKAPKNGWVIVYLSNESKEKVYFDDLYVEQTHSRISEESHYYPYGLKIAGLSSRAFDKLQNKFGYQGEFSEEEEESGWNEFDLRMYDPQIGRWTGADPYDQFSSPYVGMASDPVNKLDPDGGAAGGSLGGD